MSFLTISSGALAARIGGSLSWGADGNVREAIDADRRSDGFLRLLTDATPGTFRARGFSVTGSGRGLLDRYSRYASESRDQVEGDLDIQRKVRGRSAVWGNGRLQYRSYPDSLRRNFRREAYALGFRTPFRGGSLTVGGSGRGIDFNDTARFDRRSRLLTISYRRAIESTLEISAAVELASSHWGRPAYDWSGPKGVDQKDRGRQILAGLRYVHGWLYELNLGWESVRSNSIGYSLGRRSIEAGLSGWLPGKLLLQARGRFEGVAYRDHNLDRIFLPRSENIEANEDNNSLILRLRRSLVRQLAVEGRFSWFRNESPFVGLYYSKTVASIGLAWTPIGASDF